MRSLPLLAPLWDSPARDTAQAASHPGNQNALPTGTHQVRMEFAYVSDDYHHK